MDIFVNLAQKSIESYVKNQRVLAVPQKLSQGMKKRAAVFVSLHKKSTGELRGCIGTFFPTCKNIASEIIQNSISACSTDPRFPPVQSKELKDLEISVDILSTPEPAKKEGLDPKKYGIIVKSPSGQMGLLLPDISSVKTIEQQIEICCQKAGIGINEPIEIYRFTVERHKEN